MVWFAIYAAIYTNLYFRKYVAANMLSDTPNSAHHSFFSEAPFRKVDFGPPPVSKDEYWIQAANPLSTKTQPIWNHFRAHLNTLPENVLLMPREKSHFSIRLGLPVATFFII